MNIIHIGLGKTGSTTLQENIFPKLSDKIGYKYWISDEKILDNVKVHYAVAECPIGKWKKDCGCQSMCKCKDGDCDE